MRPLHEYGWRDWQRLRPLTHWMKTRRLNAGRERFVRRPSRGGDVTVRQRIRGRRVLVTIAFDDWEAIEMQTPMIARFVPDAFHIIADISMDDGMAEKIAAVAARHGTPYVRLPDNPWRRPEQASRTHALSINWVWRNIIKPGEPERFGFLDDDIFPTAPSDPFAALDSQPVYGVLRVVGPRWFLWVGFSTYRFDQLKDLPLDFSQDWFNGLDTGGANWQVIFRHLDRETLRFVDTKFEPYRPGADIDKAPIQWCDGWLHEVGSTRRDGHVDLAIDKRRVIKKHLAASVAASPDASLAATHAASAS